MSEPAVPVRATRAAWMVLVAGIALYFIAIVNRTALGVAGVQALDRFGIEATWLSILSIAQVAAYAALQLPAGALLDRFGPRAVMVSGAALMAVGTGLLSITDSLPVAVAARVLIGAGDAPIFISAIRLIPLWFPPRRVPVLVQVTGLAGQVGQLATAVPVAWLLRSEGWTAAFGLLAGLTLVLAGVGAFGIRLPPGVSPRRAAERERLMPAIREATRPAGTRLGFWTHFLSLFSSNTMALLWGVPFFLTAQGRSPGEASLLLTLLTVARMATGPLAGIYTARHPLRRSWLVLGSAAVQLVAWAALLLPATPRPLWQLALTMIVFGAGGPVSLIAMDYARSFSPAGRLGAATGFVNVGGFVSSIIAILLVGVALQAASPAGAAEYTLDHYRLAFTMLLVPWALGVAGVLRTRRRTREDMAAAGVVVPPLREAWGRRQERRRGRRRHGRQP